MKVRSYLTALAAAGALLASPAQALTVSFSDQAALADVEISGVLSVDKFDGTLGVLTGVSFEITGDITSLLGIVNQSGGDVSGSATTSVAFDVDAAELSLGASPDFTVEAGTGDVTLGAGQSEQFPLSADATITGTETPGADFIGPGTIDLDFLTTTSFRAAGFGGDIAISQAVDAGLTFTITYEFEEDIAPPVPLPASVSMMTLAAGLLGAVALGRRRRRR